MSVDNGLSGPRIALLIDFDNVILGVDEPGFDAELVVNALRERGSIVMGRAYGDWYRHNKHRRKLMEQGLELVETPAFGPVIKNSADIRIALDGFEIGMTQHHIDTFCLVSGDSDFLPLVKKLQYLGKRVLVIAGNKFTSDMLRRNCNEFISYENLLAQSVGATEDATTLDGAFALLHRAIAALRERGSDIRSSTVKQMMLQLNPVFSEKTFNCNQFRGFLDKAVDARIIKLGARDRVSGEITVLLPEEEEKPQDLTGEIPARSEGRERRYPDRRGEGSEGEGRPDRRRRAEMRAERVAQLSSGADSIDAVIDLAGAEEGTEGSEERTESAPRRGRFESAPREQADVLTPAGSDELSRATTTSALLGRGMKRGRLRFSSGRIQAAAAVEETAAVEEVVAAEPVVTEDIPATSVDFPVVPESEVVTPELAGIFPVEEAVTEGLAVVETAPEVAAPAEEAVTEGLAVAEEAAPAEKPKAKTRRRTPAKKPAAKKAAAEEAPAAEAAPASEPAAEAPASEAPAKKPAARRRTMRKKADIEPTPEG